MTWRRYRFNTHSIADPRPLIFNPSFPWWVSGYDGAMEEYATIIAFLPEGEPLEKYWDDAYEIEWTEEAGVWFVSRFPRDDYERAYLRAMCSSQGEEQPPTDYRQLVLREEPRFFWYEDGPSGNRIWRFPGYEPFLRLEDLLRSQETPWQTRRRRARLALRGMLSRLEPSMFLCWLVSWLSVGVAMRLAWPGMPFWVIAFLCLLWGWLVLHVGLLAAFVRAYKRVLREGQDL